MIQRVKHIAQDMYLVTFPPPSSPPSAARRIPKIMKHVIDVTRNKMTEKATPPAGVSYGLSFEFRYRDTRIQGAPRPTKTLTEFDPVILPMAESAY